MKRDELMLGLRNSSYEWLPKLLITILLSLTCIWIWYMVVTVAIPATVTLPLEEPYITGIWSSDVTGAWTKGDAQVLAGAFDHLPWRKMTWMWRQQSGNAIQVTVQTPTRTLIVTHTVPLWRTVHVLINENVSYVNISSDTVRMNGDSRDLGVFLKLPKIYAMKTSKWVHIQWMIDLCLPITAIAWLLRNKRWWGVLSFTTFGLVYCALLTTENLDVIRVNELILDSTYRHGLVFLTCLYLILQRSWSRLPITDTTINGRQFGLDLMRAIAILCVIYSHANFISDDWNGVLSDFFHKTIYLGSVGVDIFFALSGYLIGRIIIRLLPDIHQGAILQRFWMRRWLRTLPAAYVSAVIIWFISPPRIFEDYLASILFIGSFNPTNVSTVNEHWWSLSTEELFYLFVPFLLYLGVRFWSPRHVIMIVMIVIVLLMIIVRIFLTDLIPVHLIGWLHVTSYIRLDSIVWGVIIQWIHEAYPEYFEKLARVGFAPGTILILTGFMLLIEQTDWPITAVLVAHILIGIGAAILIPAFEQVSTLGWQLLDSVVRWISYISFSLYLYNNMIADAIVMHFKTATSLLKLCVLVMGYLVGTFLIATVSYRYVEVPVLKWRDKYYPEKLSNQT